MLETLTNPCLTRCLLSQVDESLLTAEDCAPPSYPCLTTNPYLAMSLPDGGLMTVPLETVRTAGGSPDSASTTTASTALGQDVLSVTAGEPSSHFNLDQLLNIVQSFQLDTTHAAQEPGGQQEKKVCWSMGLVLSKQNISPTLPVCHCKIKIQKLGLLIKL